MHSECVQEVNAFVRGGTPGKDRLKAVLPSLFKHYGIRSSKAQAAVLLQCKLFPVQGKQSVTFEFKTHDTNWLETQEPL